MTTTADSNSTTTTPTTIAELGPHDVLCGRDKKCSINGGNRRFRALINENVSRYEDCDTKFERSKAIGAILKELVENPEGSIRFFKRVKGSDTNDDHARIEQLDEKQSREKVAHALRDYASQRRNNKAKQQSATLSPRARSPEPNYRVLPGSNPPATLSNSGPNTQGGFSMTELMKEEAKLLAQIQALENTEKSSSQAAYQVPLEASNMNYPRQNGYPQNQMNSFQGNQSESVNNYNYQGQSQQNQRYYRQQQQYQQYHNQQRQQALEDENEGSEGYDDFNVEDYNEFILPLGSANDGSNNRILPQSGNQQYRQQPLKQPVDEASEGYDNFDDRIEPLRGGSSRSFEKAGSNRSVKKQGSLRQMEVFDKSGSNRSIKHQGSLRQIDVFQTSGRSSLSRPHDSIGEMDLMRMSMDTLTLGDSTVDFDQSKFDMSAQKFDSSMQNMSTQKLELSMPTLDMSMQNMSTQKLELSMPTLDMSMQNMSTPKLDVSLPTLDSSMQQSKLDMSIQTIDTEVLNQKRSSP